MVCLQISWTPNIQQLKKYSQREKKLFFLLVILSVVSFVLFICLLVPKKGDICYTPECIIAAHHVITTVDQTADPCEDFYKFACGNFLKTAIANDQVSPLKSLEDMKENALKQLVMEDRGDEANLTKSFRDQRKYFRSCMNTTAIEANKDEAFLKDLKYVLGGWPLSQGYSLDVFWPEAMIRARDSGLLHNYFMDVDINVDFNSSTVYLEVQLPPKVYYDKKLWREVNLDNIIKMAEHWGSHSISASWEVKQTIEFAKNLNKIVEKARNASANLTFEKKKMNISKLNNLHFPRIHWLQFFKNITGLDSLQDDDVILFNFDGDEYFKDLYYLLQKTQKKSWINYIAILFIIDDCRSLSHEIESLCTAINSSAKKDFTRRDYCFDRAISNFKGVAEAQYIRKRVTQEKRLHITEIINDVKKEMEINLKKNHWMDQESKEAAVKHLKKITSAIGWTDSVFNETQFEELFGYSTAELTSNNIINISHQLSKLYLDYQFKKIKQPFSHQIQHALGVPVLDVNALYVKHWEVLILIAPILYQPVYHINRPEYLNYGALGSIIGHELTHAFGKYNEEDAKVFGKADDDFWTAETIRNYDREKKCLNEEYENYTLGLDKVLENSSASLEENIADFTGLNTAYKAYQKWVYRHGVERQLPGIKYTPNQLFWIMSSTYMCLEPKLKDPEGRRSVKEQRHNVHALASFRVVGPIRNSPYFGEDFGCKVGRRMNPEKKCRLFV